MFHFSKALFAAALTIGLGGCFTSDVVLFGDGEASAPYDRITFQAQGDEDISVAIREGSGYVVEEQDTRLELRFLEIGTDTYIVETSGEQDGQIMRLLAGLKVDTAAGTAEVYKVMASAGDVGPGLRSCPDDTVCVDDIKAFGDMVLKEIASGAAPSATYDITVE